jgi:PAS domain S-box-containing protein
MSGSSPRGEPLRLLLLEDNPDDAAIVQGELVRAGFTLDSRVARDRASFTAGLEAGTDIVIADYVLPGFTAMDALRIARQRWPMLPFLVVTGAVGEEKAVECMREGADDLLMKDRLARLGPAVRRALEAHRLRETQRTTGEQLRQSEELFRALITSSPLPIVSIDLSGTVRLWNPAAERVFGWSASEVLGGPLPFLGPQHHAEYLAIQERLRAGETVNGIEVSRLRLDGSTIDVELHAAPLHDAAGRVSGNVALLEDITGRRQREVRWRQLSAAMEYTPDTIVLTDPSRVISWVNPAFEATTLWSRAEAIGSTLQILRSGRHDDAFYATLRNTISSGSVWRGLIVNRRRDGTLYHEEKTIAPILGADGAIIGYVGIGRDVTAQVSMEAALRQSQKMEAVGLLAGGVAHDFNNMLQVISGYLEMIDRIPGDPAAPYLDEIRRATDRAAGLTRQLLAFSRRQDLQMKPSDLNALVGNLSAMIRRLIGDAVQLAFHPGAGLPTVSIDPGQIEQVVLNLCINARDAMPAGGELVIATDAVHLDAGFAALRPGSFTGPAALLSVRDTGTGIDEATRARLFEPFFTTKEEGRGTGLGLSVVYGIVKQHGGYIDVESEPGRGTRFAIWLPAAPSAVVALDTAGPPPAATGGSETILLAEDEASIRDLTAMALGEAGYRVLCAANGREAVELFRDHRGEIAAAVLDASMPRLSGIETLHHLRSDGAAFPVLFVTGYAAGTLQEELAREPSLEVLHKPFAFQDLLARVRGMIDRSRGAQGIR